MFRGQQGYRGHWGAPMGVGAIGGTGAVAENLGPSGGVGLAGMHWGGRWTGDPTTLGPSPGSQHSHWFSLGSDLPGQGQASAEMSSAGYYIHLALI